MKRLSAVLGAILLLGVGAAVAIAGNGGSTHQGNAGHNQYHEKPGCGPWQKHGHAGKSGYHHGQPPKDHHRGDCPKPPDKCDRHGYFTGYGWGGGHHDRDCGCPPAKKGKFSTYGTHGGSKGKGDCGRSSTRLRFAPVTRA